MKKSISLAVAGVALLGIVGNSPADTKVDFVKQIQPIFSKSCVECHGPDKQKAHLRLDSKSGGGKGGEVGVVIVPGDASKSDLYRRVSLAPGSDDIMPNKGDPLTKAQTDLIRDWINEGAIRQESAVAKEESAEPSAVAVVKLGEIKPSAAELQATSKLEALGVSIEPIAAGLNWHEASFGFVRPQVH